MYLHANPDPPTFGGPGCTSLVLADPTVPPFTEGAKEWGLHAAGDASILEHSITGANLMLAGARADTLCQRQHLTAPDAHSAELKAAGSLLQNVLPLRGQLLELSIYQDPPTPVYIDSASTVFVIQDKRAVKRSVWTLRIARVLQEAQLLREIIALKISERDNFADPEIKSTTIKVWRRHLWYTNNLPGEMPDL